MAASLFIFSTSLAATTLIPTKTLKAPTRTPKTLYLHTITPTPPLPLLRLSATSHSSSSPPPVASLAATDFVEKDFSFLDSASAEVDPAIRARVIAAAELSPASKVLVAMPTTNFVNSLAESSPCEVVVAVHESLFALASVKEEQDMVRCFHFDGEGKLFDAVPERFRFDAVFVSYFPAMGVSAADLLQSLKKKCNKGAKVVIFIDQGRQMVEQHRQKYPDIVTSDLPVKSTWEKAAADNTYHIMELVDEPAIYLLVLRFGR